MSTSDVYFPAGTTVVVPTYGPQLAKMMYVGARVIRGRDWKWDEQVRSVLRQQGSSALRPTPLEVGKDRKISDMIKK